VSNMLWKPDQTFYPSPRMAMQAPRERLAYVVTFNPDPANWRHGALCVVDVDPGLSHPQPGGRPHRGP
jgi:selenium-binding protein 1